MIILIPQTLAPYTPRLPHCHQNTLFLLPHLEKPLLPHFIPPPEKELERNSAALGKTSDKDFFVAYSKENSQVNKILWMKTLLWVWKRHRLHILLHQPHKYQQEMKGYGKLTQISFPKRHEDYQLEL